MWAPRFAGFTFDGLSRCVCAKTTPVTSPSCRVFGRSNHRFCHLSRESAGGRSHLRIQRMARPPSPATGDRRKTSLRCLQCSSIHYGALVLALAQFQPCDCLSTGIKRSSATQVRLESSRRPSTMNLYRSRHQDGHRLDTARHRNGVSLLPGRLSHLASRKEFDSKPGR